MTINGSSPKKQSATGYGFNFAIGFWLASLFFVPFVVIIGYITLAILRALFG
jgi:hypothetical protein